MSPEQAAGRVIDHRADVYALGLILYEMLTGKLPFESDDTIVLLTKHLTEPPPALPGSVPRPVAELTLQLLAKEPDSRPATAQEVADRIEHLLEEHAPGFVSAPSARSTHAAISPASLGARDSSADVARAATVLSTGRAGGSRVRTLATASAARVAAWGQRLAPLGARAVEIGRRQLWNRVPVWVVAAGVTIVLIGVIALSGSEPPPKVATSGGTHRPVGATSEPAAQNADPAEEQEDEDEDEAAQSALDPELQRVITAARGGSQDALYALELRKPATRSKFEWLAIAQGRLKRRQVKEALAAYERAIEMDANMAGNHKMLGGLRYFAEKETTSELVIDFAAEHMGRYGADLLFHIWFSTSRMTAATQRAKELLDSGDMQEHVSEPLRIALELREAKSCEDFKELLPKAHQAADERSLGPLKDLAKTRGCGPEKKDDCWPCLRDSALLKETLEQAQMRKAPLFRSRRWR
jgi:hypothetical protein